MAFRAFTIQLPSSLLRPHHGLHRTHKGDREDVGPLAVQGLAGHPAPEFLIAQDSRLAVSYMLNFAKKDRRVTSEVSNFMTFRLAGVRDPKGREWLLFQVCFCLLHSRASQLIRCDRSIQDPEARNA